MVDGDIVYKVNAALYLHSKGSGYDFFTYNGKTRANTNSFLRDRNKWKFEKIGANMRTRDHVIEYLVSNYIEGNGYIVKFTDEPYKKWCAYKESLDYRFKQDTLKIKESGKNLLELLVSGEISIYYVIVHEIVTRGGFSSEYAEDFLWTGSYKPIVDRYSRFIENYWNIDKEKLLTFL